jgi:hypothetical protein
MISRRETLTGGASAAAGSLTACGRLNKVGSVGKSGLDNSGKTWSYNRLNGMERFEVRAGDICEGDHAVERSEVGLYRPAAWRKDIWLSYKVLLEKGPKLSAPWLIIGQWHAFSDPWDAAVDPPVSLSVCGDWLKIKTCSDARLQQRHNPPVFLRFESPFERGAWRHFVHRVRFDPNGRGSLQIWIDGTLVVQAERIALGFNDIIAPYFKYGLYRPVGDPSPVTAWYADVRLFGSWVADRDGPFASTPASPS